MENLSSSFFFYIILKGSRHQSEVHGCILHFHAVSGRPLQECWVEATCELSSDKNNAGHFVFTQVQQDKRKLTPELSLWETLRLLETASFSATLIVIAWEQLVEGSLQNG